MEELFQKARPVWAAGREKEENCELTFRALLPQGTLRLSLAASTLYRLWVNGKFVGAGPARTSHGYYCVDHYDLSEHLSGQVNVLAVEVLGCNVCTYDTLNQPSFLTAEVTREGTAVVWTQEDAEPEDAPAPCAAMADAEGLPRGCGFAVYDLRRRVGRTQRYSFQRAFAESYYLAAEKQTFYTDPKAAMTLTGRAAFQGNAGESGREMAGIVRERAALQPQKRYLERSARMPLFEYLPVKSLLGTGMVDFAGLSVTPSPESSEHLSEQAARFTYTPSKELLRRTQLLEEEAFLDGGPCGGESLPAKENGDSSASDSLPVCLSDGYALLDFPYNATGFLRFRVECREPCTVYLLFDELIQNGLVNFQRLGKSCSSFRYCLDAGTHTIMTFAPYVMKYIQFVARGSLKICEAGMVEYQHPPVPLRVKLPDGDLQLRSIYEAALRTYRANAVDIFMDCPSRERAGWLCDSFFTARVEHTLTGECVLEKSFLKNFLRPEHFDDLPEGMLPMCYPSDHPNGNFIPNWAMWYVLELEEYAKRSGDMKLVEQARERVYGLLRYFAPFENELGLLEKLEKWIFLEWSRANDPDVVQEVNFPTNMLYMRMLQAVANLYGDEALREKAAKLRGVIRKRSLRGVFYTDNERRTPEGLVNPGNCTEVCQYYAFFTGVATRNEDGQLWETLLTEFGPQRRQTGLHPEVAFANAFIGNYLRIELIYRAGLYDKVLENIRGYFAKMARRTGTLWEHDTPGASCNHGFASHVIYWLAGIYGTEAAGMEPPLP